MTHEMETAYTKVHQPEDDQQEYFSKDASHQTKLFYYTSALLLVVYTVIALGAPLLSLPCHLEPTTRQYANPDYVPDPCRWTRYAILGGLTKWECEVMHSLARPILPQTSHPILPISHRMLLSRNARCASVCSSASSADRSSASSGGVRTARRGSAPCRWSRSAGAYPLSPPYPPPDPPVRHASPNWKSPV